MKIYELVILKLDENMIIAAGYHRCSGFSFYDSVRSNKGHVCCCTQCYVFRNMSTMMENEMFFSICFRWKITDTQTLLLPYLGATKISLTPLKFITLGGCILMSQMKAKGPSREMCKI